MSARLRQLINDQTASINYQKLIKSMAVQVEITAVDQELIHVNGKELRKDMNGNWIAKEELTSMELRFFREFLGSLMRVSTPIQKATYKI